MKVLFVNPYIHDFTAYDLWLRPLGLYYLTASVRRFSDVEIHWLDALDRFQAGMEVGGRADGRGKYRREFVRKPVIYEGVPRNYSRYGMPLELFQSKLASLPEMDVVLVTSLMTYWLEGLQFTLKTVRLRFPRAKVVVGGVLPSLAPAAARALLAADHFVQGFGESAVLNVLKNLGARVTGVPTFGAADEFPLPALDLAGTQRYLPLLTARGCPLRCSYCASRLLNPVFLERSPAGILAEIEARREIFDTRHFIIFDDALLMNKKKRFLPVFSQLAAAGKGGLHFHTPNGLHTREIDKETAAVMHAAGFTTIRLAFESLAPRILRRSDNKVGKEQMEIAVHNLELAGYRRSQIGAYLLFGYPGQSMAEMKAFISDLGVVPHLALLSPVPGTADFRALQRQGVLSTPLDPLETNKIYFLYQKSGFSGEEIIKVNEMAAEITKANLDPNGD
ncbi:MAG: B12-binding domain-containing radical SAM protein [Candidatus Aminicenantes bacterium]|nr:B12-binding domain-containing radical SAM protein [Candidatus Aminicenantes bacterium]